MRSNKLRNSLWAIYAAGAGAGLIFLLWHTAWIDEDAFITLRVIDNLNAGYGARYNIHERAQVYSHPLWFLLLSGLYWIWPNPVLSAVSLGALCTCAAIAIVWKRINNPIASSILLLALCSSKAWVDYATAGLENSLGYLLFAIVWGLLNRPQHPPSIARMVMFSAGLVRLDYLLIVLPSLTAHFYSIWEEGRIPALKALTKAAVPILAWGVFATWYYGSPLPTTFFAKVGGEVPITVRLSWGLYHLGYFTKFDPIGVCLLVAGCVIGLRDAPALVCGVVFYVVWFLFIGGDYQVGRFFAVPIFLCALFLVPTISSNLMTRAVFVATSVVVLALHPRAPTSSWYGKVTDLELTVMPGPNGHRMGMNDERMLLFPVFGLRSSMSGDKSLLRLTRKNCEGRAVQVAVRWGVGRHGWDACRQEITIDEIGLVDPFIARQPMRLPERFVPGHMAKAIPHGYLQTLCSGKNDIKNPAMARNYEILKKVSSGSLSSIDRAAAMFSLITLDWEGSRETSVTHEVLLDRCQHPEPLP